LYRKPEKVLFNTIISSDVLELLLDPATVMAKMLSTICHSPALCYFDLELHEPGSQHVTHDTRFLHGLVRVKEFAFTHNTTPIGFSRDQDHVHAIGSCNS